MIIDVSRQNSTELKKILADIKQRALSWSSQLSQGFYDQENDDEDDVVASEIENRPEINFSIDQEGEEGVGVNMEDIMILIDLTIQTGALAASCQLQAQYGGREINSEIIETYQSLSNDSEALLRNIAEDWQELTNLEGWDSLSENTNLPNLDGGGNKNKPPQRITKQSEFRPKVGVVRKELTTDNDYQVVIPGWPKIPVPHMSGYTLANHVDVLDSKLILLYIKGLELGLLRFENQEAAEKQYSLLVQEIEQAQSYFYAVAVEEKGQPEEKTAWQVYYKLDSLKQKVAKYEEIIVRNY